MLLMILGLVLWSAAHLVKPMAPAWRRGLAERYGEGPVKGAMAVLILLSLVLMVIGYQRAAFIPVWNPPPWTVHLNNLLMLLAVVLFAGTAPKSPVRRFTRHPMLNGVKTWAVAHLAVNGDLASIILFGGLLAWGVVAMVAINRRDGKPPQEYEWSGARWARTLAISLVVFAVIAAVHTWVGVWPFPR
ncbi:MAG TPA: NnrU family protein [Thermohalobaculum sp.]|nr:NnrU family protein [Thermohalobaculum sp.]